MKIHFGRRGLSALLSLLMVVGLFTVSGFGAAAAGTKELAFQTWNATALVDAANAKGTKNSHDAPIFTTYSQVIGRRSIATFNYFIYGVKIEREKNGVPQIFNGQAGTMFIRLIADEGYSDGNLCTFDAAYAVSTFGEQYKTDMLITYDEYEATPTQVDPIDGYEYKEFALRVEMDGSDYDNAEAGDMELRVISQNNDYSTTVYSIEFVDDADNVLTKVSGEQMGSISGIDGTYENISNAPDVPAGIASYVGHDEPALSNRGEPYSIYNSDGLNRKENETYTLLDSLGAQLDAGDYSFSFNMATMFSCGEKKVLYNVIDETADGEVIATLDVDLKMVQATVGTDSGTFETRTLPFTIDESRAGHKINFKVSLYNQTDYWLRSVSLNLNVDEDEPAPAEAQAVIDAITNLEITDVQATAAARTSYEALSTLGKAWVGSTLAAKLDSYEKAQADAAAVVAAIDALGNKDDVTKDNYTTKTEALEAAEELYNALAKLVGSDVVIPLVPNAQALKDYRVAYNVAKKAAEDEAREQARQAAIQKAIKAIDDIGPVEEINKDNVTDKQTLVAAAKRAVQELIDVYGQESQEDVTNYAIIDQAEKKIAEILAEPEYMLGNVNNDQSIDAADALMALQHSVQLITLNETQFLAANVDGNEVVDASDALMILQCSVNLIKPEDFPAAKK